MKWLSIIVICCALARSAHSQSSTTLPSELWAEMIQDRKFFSAVKDEPGGSPWRPIGIPGMVTMDREAPYVGQQSLAIQIPGSGAETGISQAGLKVVKGMKYTGRIVMAADEGVAPVVVQLALHDGQVLTQRLEQVGQEYKTYPLEFTAPISSENVRLEIISNAGPGFLRIGVISIMPSDNVKGFRPDAVDRLKESKSPSFQWKLGPGDWKKGLGKDRDRRAPEAGQEGVGVEPNDVGIHEFMDLMELIGAEAIVTPQKDGPELNEYLTSSPSTPMGKLRAENGRELPWTKVRVGG